MCFPFNPLSIFEFNRDELLTSNERIGCITSLVNYQSNCFINGLFFFSFFTYFFLWFFKQLLGSPDDSDLGFLRSDNARKYVKQLPHFPKQPFAMKFPHVSPVAIDLAEKMLVFDPCKRITGILPNSTLNKLPFHLYFFLTHFSKRIFSSSYWYTQSWGGAESPIPIWSSWDKWGAHLPISFRLWFWTCILEWGRYKGANMEGVSEF